MLFKREPGGGLAAHGMSAGERLLGRNPTKPFSLPDETILGSVWRRPERITGQDSDHRSTAEFDHLGTHKFDLSGILQGAFAGHAKATPQRQPRVCRTMQHWLNCSSPMLTMRTRAGDARALKILDRRAMAD